MVHAAAVDVARLVNLVLLVLVIVGHLLIVREVVSRCFRLSMPWLLWVALCGVLVGAGVAVPWALVRHVGLRWAGAPAGWQAYGAACVAALAAVTALRLRPRKSPALLGESGPVVDIAARLAAPPAGRGVRSWVARAPGNGVFRVEFAERHVAVPGLPPALDGLSVLHLTDLHFNGTPDLAFFEHALRLAQDLRPDLVALTGDVLDRHGLADWLPTTLGRLEAPLGRYFVLGNHDAYDEPEVIRGALRDTGWVDVGGRAAVYPVRGHGLLIAGDERPWLGAGPDLGPAAGGDAFGIAPSESLRLLLAHTPERFAWARRQGFHLVLAGHLHGGQIDLPLFGPLSGGRYHAGLFQAGGTVMHVSRGLGAVFPFRWRCPAEVTKLVLRVSDGRYARG